MPLPLSPEAQDRARGALLGLAVGDALGTTLEFTERDQKPHHTEMTGGGPFGLEPGQWTDDTSMALALADSLIERRGFDPRDLMTRFVAWRKKGDYSCTGTCFDIGITTQRALTTFQRTGEPFAGSTALGRRGQRLHHETGARSCCSRFSPTRPRPYSWPWTRAGSTHATAECPGGLRALRRPSSATPILGDRTPLRPRWSG